MKKRGWFVAAVAAAMIAGIGTALVLRSQAPLALSAGTALPHPRPLPEFSLVDARGAPFRRDAFEGRWSLLFAGFTNCPDVCPTTLALFAALRARVPGDRLQLVFLSVDPERDTPEQIARYLAHFGPGLVGVTGTDAEIARLTRELGLAYVVNPDPDSDYSVDHSTALVLIDPQARAAGYFTAPHDLDALAADLAPLAAGA